MPQKAKVPLNNIWAKDWNHTPTYPNIQSTDYMKKILVYYPKNPNALNPITLANDKKPDVFQNHSSHSPQRSLYRKISSRYKSIYFKNINLNGLQSPKNPVLTNIKTLKISAELTASRFKPPLCLKKLLKLNKKIQSLDISPVYQTPAPLVKYLRFQRSLNSLLINSLPSLTITQYKRLLFTSRNTLKTLTITGYIPQEYMDKSNRFTSLLETFFDLPSLERFRLEAKVSDDFDFNRVPFTKLHQQQRKIKFDIRLGHSTEKLSLTDKNASLMKHLDFLGINMRERWPSLLFEHDKVQKNHLKAQQESQNLLFLNVSQMKCLILLDLFSVCQNIKTLDLILSEENSAVMDFSGLHKLHNLQHLFIKLHAFDDTPTNLLESLVLYSQRNQTLETMSFQFFKGTISEDYAQLLPFWENCASTVEKVILQFSHTDANHDDIELFYKGLDKLSKLKSLTVLVNGMSFLKAHLDLFLSHYSLLTNILADKLALEELHFSAPHIDTRCLNLNFPANKAIKSFGVSLGTTELNKSLLRNILSLPGLQMLELNLPALYEDEWVKIFKILRSMRAMEIVKIRAMLDWSDESNNKVLKNDIRKLMDQHPVLKLMMFESEDSTELQVFRKECLWNEMKEFISKNYFQNHKVFIDGQFSFY